MAISGLTACRMAHGARRPVTWPIGLRSGSRAQECLDWANDRQQQTRGLVPAIGNEGEK
ncbi:MAG: hypothetical protein JEZ06_15045 [Anaerolineaceae bacterium]|nr:hypothetical protein [Anaerolineaceae bacterium]